MKKVLFILTSHGQLGSTGKETGYYHGEAAHPWNVLTEAGYEVEFASVKGGSPPVTGAKPDDPIEKAFLEDPGVIEALSNTMDLDSVDPAEYEAVHLPGGHGTMFDFADSPRLAQIVAEIYESGGAVSAVCHGPAGLVNVKLSDGSYLVDGKRLACFTDDEERAVELDTVVPYLLESTLKERGAVHSKAENFKPHVEVDGRLVTGQNPASATPMAEALVRVLHKKGAVESASAM